MGIPIHQITALSSYVLGKSLRGRGRFPLVLMLEPLFRCNLNCAGCGKIDYPEEVLARRMSVAECIEAAEECGAPVVSIPGGEPLLHPEIGGIVRGLVARKKFVYLCTNGLLLEGKLGEFEPSRYLSFSVHIDGMRERHDEIVSCPGVFDKAVAAIGEAVRRGFRVTTNTTLFRSSTPEDAARLFDFLTTLGVEAMTVSPAFSYEDTDDGICLDRRSTVELFRPLVEMSRKRGWAFNHSGLYLDFLAGRQDYRCTPWGNPTRNVFGWQRPCYLLNDGYAGSYRELMEETDWSGYGLDRDPRCADCMVHCGYEPTAVLDAVKNPMKALLVRLGRGRGGGGVSDEAGAAGDAGQGPGAGEVVGAGTAVKDLRGR
ncbi:MAG: adenosyl-hopene transferase HpnH [Thermodesulfobacteriota bacterium]